MSVLIKGMEMPKRCYDCPLYRSGNKISNTYSYCSISNSKVERFKISRPEDCPLIELQPHGRLIDADALTKVFDLAQESAVKDKRDYASAFYSGTAMCTEWWCVEDMVETAPTIVEAEEG